MRVAPISGEKTAIHLVHGGAVYNEEGAVIEATDTGGECGPGVKCAIYAGPRNGGALPVPDAELVNEGTIIGNVKLWGDDAHWVRLYAGSSIQGDLDLGGHPSSALFLTAGAGKPQRHSEAVTGATILAGELQKGGEGTWIIDKDVPAAWVAIDGGTLQIGDGGTQGSLVDTSTIFIFSGGTLRFDRSDDVVSDVALVGSSPAATTVKAGSDPDLDQRKLQPGLVVVEEGTLRFRFADPSIVWPELRVGAISNSGTLVVDSDYRLKTSANITGSGSFIKEGTGTLDMLGAGTYTGITRVEHGALLPTSLAGDVIVAMGASLGGWSDYFARNKGMGDIAGDVTNHGTAVVAGGDSRVGGDYTQSASGTLSVELGGKLLVEGAANLAGTLEVIGAALDFIPNDHTEVLSAAGGINGTFDQLVKAPGVVFLSNTIHYDGNSVWLDTTGLDITVAATGGGIGYTPASMSAAERVQGAFEQLNRRISTNALAGVPDEFLQAAGRFQRAPTIEAAQASLRSLSGELHAAGTTMTFRAIDAGNQALSDHLDHLREGRAGPGMWTQRLDGSGAIARSGFDGVGFLFDGWLVGNDFRIGQSGEAGFAFGSGVARQQQAEGTGSEASRRSEGMVYAGLAGERWYAQGRVGFAHVQQDVDRLLLLGRWVDGVWTRYQGGYEAAYGEAGLRLDAASLRITPFVGLEYARVERDGFAEQGAGGFGLRSDAQAVSRSQASVGLRAARPRPASSAWSSGRRWRASVCRAAAAWSASASMPAWRCARGCRWASTTNAASTRAPGAPV